MSFQEFDTTEIEHEKHRPKGNGAFRLEGFTWKGFS